MALVFAFVTFLILLGIGKCKDYQKNEEKLSVIERRLDVISEVNKLLSKGLMPRVQNNHNRDRKLDSEHAREFILVEELDGGVLESSTLEESVGGRTVPALRPLTAMNDTELEERVTVLEFQMANVQADIATINSDVSVVTDDLTTLGSEVDDLEEDVEAQLTLLELDIFLIQSDQITQDERLQELEENMESVAGTLLNLNDAISNLETAFQELNSSLAEVSEIVDDLGEFVTDLDMRLNRLELNGTFAFHAVLNSYISIPETTIVVFPFVNVNLGNGYNGATGVFTVPPGGDDLYCFHTHYLVQAGESAGFGIDRNEELLCVAQGDGTNGGDYSATSCGAATTLNEGKSLDNDGLNSSLVN